MNGASEQKKVRNKLTSLPTQEGAGVQLHRAFGYHEQGLFDPFLLFDDFRGDAPANYEAGFPWHPHRGIETVTYMLKGTVEHGDSIGNSGVLGPGDIQWMTAGSGIIHQEMPEGDEAGRMYGFQLWVNLPASMKMTCPRYQDIASDQVPSVVIPKETGSIVVKVLCGSFFSSEAYAEKTDPAQGAAPATGPVEGIAAEPRYLDITLSAETEFTIPDEEGHTVFAYVIEGSGWFGSAAQEKSSDENRESSKAGLQKAENRDLILFSTRGSSVSVRSETSGMRFLLISGRPLQEPVAWGGPIVMNTREELRKAFSEYHSGTFLHHADRSGSY